MSSPDLCNTSAANITSDIVEYLDCGDVSDKITFGDASTLALANGTFCSISNEIATDDIRGVITPTPESESESDFHHFSEIFYSDSNSNSGKNQFSYCTAVSSLVVHKGLWMTNELTAGINSSTVGKLIFAGIGIGI